MPQQLIKLIEDNAAFGEFLLKVNEAQELERSARKMLERTLASLESVDKLGLHVNWLTLRDAVTGISKAYEKNLLDKDDIVRTAKFTYLRQSQFMMVLVYEAFEDFVKYVCSKHFAFKDGGFRFPEKFNDLIEKFPSLAELKLPSGHGDFHSSKVEFDFYFWEFTYLARDLRQVIVHEHGRVKSFDRRFAKLRALDSFEDVDEDRFGFLRGVYIQFFREQCGYYYVCTAGEDDFYESNFNFILERLKSYAFFMAKACLVDIESK